MMGMRWANSEAEILETGEGHSLAVFLFSTEEKREINCIFKMEMRFSAFEAKGGER